MRRNDHPENHLHKSEQRHARRSSVSNSIKMTILRRNVNMTARTFRDGSMIWLSMNVITMNTNERHQHIMNDTNTPWNKFLQTKNTNAIMKRSSHVFPARARRLQSSYRRKTSRQARASWGGASTRRPMVSTGAARKQPSMNRQLRRLCLNKRQDLCASQNICSCICTHKSTQSKSYCHCHCELPNQTLCGTYASTSPETRCKTP